MTTAKHNFDQDPPTFYGEGFDIDRDQIRLTAGLKKVYDVLKDEGWHTLADIEEKTGVPEASASAAMRTLRRPENGGYFIDRRYISNGLYKYRLDHKKRTNFKPKAAKPVDVIKLEAEHARMKKALNDIWGIAPDLEINALCKKGLGLC